MPETKQVTFSLKEVAEALALKAGVDEGLWGLYVEFGIAGGNVQTGPSGDEMNPAAIVPILKLGIQRFEKPSGMTVDASALAPKKSKRKPAS